MEDNEFIAKLILVARKIVTTKEDIENAKISLIELKRWNFLREDCIKAIEISLNLYNLFRILAEDEQVFLLELFDRAARRRE